MGDKHNLTIRRARRSTKTELTDKEWSALKAAVHSLATVLARHDIHSAVHVLADNGVSTNVSQLQGLPQRLHVWKETYEC